MWRKQTFGYWKHRRCESHNNHLPLLPSLFLPYNDAPYIQFSLSIKHYSIAVAILKSSNYPLTKAFAINMNQSSCLPAVRFFRNFKMVFIPYLKWFQIFLFNKLLKFFSSRPSSKKETFQFPTCILSLWTLFQMRNQYSDIFLFLLYVYSMLLC